MRGIQRYNRNVEKLHSTPPGSKSSGEFFETGEAAPVLAGLTALIDRLAHRGLSGFARARLSSDRLAMLAVGGFGRRELFPYSDVDILISDRARIADRRR